MISVAPNGQEIARNFAATPAVTPAPVIPQDRPMTNSDIVNRALYTPPLPTQPPPVQPKIGLTPMQALNEQFANSKQWQTTMTNQIKERKMLGLDPTEYVAEEKPGLTAGTLPEIQVRRKTKEEKQADWNELNTMAMAGGSVGIGPDGKPQPMAIQPVEDLFDNKGALDSVYYETTPDKNNKQDYIQRKAYLEQAKPIRDKIVKAFISMPKPESKEDVNRMIQSLGVDPRFKQLAINTVTKILERSNPDLIKTIRGDRLVEKANDKSILDFARQNATWEGADKMSDREMIAKARQTPEMMAQLQRENRLYRLDPVTYKPVQVPDTVESAAEKEATTEEKKLNLKIEAYKARAAQDPNLVFRYAPNGEPQLMTKEAVERERADEARKVEAEQRAMEKTMYESQKAEREQQKFEREQKPEYKTWLRNEEQKAKFKEARLIQLEGQHLKDQSNDNLDQNVVEANYIKALNDLETNPRYQPSPAPGEAPEAPTQQSLTPDQRAGKASGRIEMGAVPTEQVVQGQPPVSNADRLVKQSLAIQERLKRPDLSQEDRVALAQANAVLQQKIIEESKRQNMVQQ